MRCVFVFVCVSVCVCVRGVEGAGRSTEETECIKKTL